MNSISINETDIPICTLYEVILDEIVGSVDVMRISYCQYRVLVITELYRIRGTPCDPCHQDTITVIMDTFALQPDRISFATKRCSQQQLPSVTTL